MDRLAVTLVIMGLFFILGSVYNILLVFLGPPERWQKWPKILKLSQGSQRTVAIILAINYTIVGLVLLLMGIAHLYSEYLGGGDD
jgi:hypothetical protein